MKNYILLLILLLSNCFDNNKSGNVESRKPEDKKFTVEEMEKCEKEIQAITHSLRNQIHEIEKEDKYKNKGREFYGEILTYDGKKFTNKDEYKQILTKIKDLEKIVKDFLFKIKTVFILKIDNKEEKLNLLDLERKNGIIISNSLNIKTVKLHTLKNVEVEHLIVGDENAQEDKAREIKIKKVTQVIKKAIGLLKEKKEVEIEEYKITLNTDLPSINSEKDLLDNIEISDFKCSILNVKDEDLSKITSGDYIIIKK